MNVEEAVESFSENRIKILSAIFSPFTFGGNQSFKHAVFQIQDSL